MDSKYMHDIFKLIYQLLVVRLLSTSSRSKFTTKHDITTNLRKCSIIPYVAMVREAVVHKSKLAFLAVLLNRI